MTTRVYIDGQVVDRDQARVPVFDRQFLYGDGVFETLRTYGGRPFTLTAHLRRLWRSAAGLYMELPFTPQDLEDIVLTTLAAAGNEESSVRIMVTRGEGEFGLDISRALEPRLVVIVRPVVRPDPLVVAEGVTVAVPSVRRIPSQSLPGHIKSGNYLNQTLALAEGRRRGAFEVIMLDSQQQVVEASTSNVFWVRGGQLYTPSLDAGCLPGITRALILGLSRAQGLLVNEGIYPVSHLLEAEEAFLTATLKEVLPIRQADHQTYPAPGPVTAGLLEAYHGLIDQHMAGTLTDDVLDALLAPS